MKEPEKSLDGAFRAQAEKEIESRAVSFGAPFSEVDLLRLNHELEVHQVELELMNEELQRSVAAVRALSEKYVELYDFAPAGYITLSEEGMITEGNFAASSLLGLSRSQLIGQSFARFVSLECRTLYSGFLRNAFKRERKEYCEIALSVSKGKTIDAHLTGVVELGQEQCFITISDISERKRAEKELSKARDMAVLSERLKSSFLANLSHEIRTPMNGILGFTDLLKNPSLSLENQKEYIRMIKLSGSRLLSILNDIISMSQIESENMDVNLEDSDINSIMFDLYDFFLPEAKRKNISLELKKNCEFSTCKINTDQDKFYGILSNLIKNAIKFTEKGSVVFGYSIQDDHWDFFVKDTGIGVKESDRELIFERFRQVDDAMTRRYDGSGLGLSIAKAYSEMLGGRIWVGDSSSKGSTFHFTIPVDSQ